MIIHRLEDTWGCLVSPALKEAMVFLRGLGPDTPDGEYEIRGRQIFARVMRYMSIPRKEGRLESHRRYADIQALLSGEEYIEWAPLTGDEEAEYDQEADVSFHPVPPAPDGVVRLERLDAIPERYACCIDLGVRWWGQIRVEEAAADPRRAVDRALAGLAQNLEAFVGDLAS